MCLQSLPADAPILQINMFRLPDEGLEDLKGLDTHHNEETWKGARV